MLTWLTGIWKIGSGFFVAHRLLFAVGFAGVVCLWAWYHLAHDRAREAQLVAQNGQIELLTNDNTSKATLIESLNERIRRSNAEKLEAIENAASRIAFAEEQARLARSESDRISEELALVRFETLENMRDDEEYADWAFYDVHPLVWNQLHDANAGIATDDE